MIKMIVFDMAGTTVNEDNVVYKTLQKSITEAGYPVTLEQVLAEGAGKEKLQAAKSILKKYAGVEDELIAKAIHDQFRESLQTAYAELNVTPQSNALILFHALHERNIKTVLNTGYDRATAELLIDKLWWFKGIDFDTLVTASDVSNSRPGPDMILFAMKEFGITDPRQVVKVGDSIIDIEEGRNAACALNIGITTGAHTREQLESASPDYIIDNLIDLLNILDKENAKQ